MRLLGRHWWAARLGQQATGCHADWAKALAGRAKERSEGRPGHGLARREGAQLGSCRWLGRCRETGKETLGQAKA